ncbi:pupal cuticle protein G1A-like [Diabrotica undecimpunctata]|uniref:pupal cuticle protein G1A-like n=1 Tax=Diabrotica undecimpunctata TaxID=50387 RepID=UPI003B6365CF
MAFKIVIFASFLAYTNAGLLGAPAVATYSAAPAVSSAYIHSAPLEIAKPVLSAYAAAPVAIHAPAYGSSHQSVERSLGGAQSISHYSKAIDSAFSSVRKYDTRITNDALSFGVAAHAPVAAYAAAPVAKALAPTIAYSAAPSVSSSYIQHAQPIIAKAVAPVAVAAPEHLTYTAPAHVAYASHNPIIAKAVHAPVFQSYSAPFLTKTIAPVAAPLTVSAGPVVTKAAIGYSPASVVAHTTFTGLGTAYEW